MEDNGQTYFPSADSQQPFVPFSGGQVDPQSGSVIVDFIKKNAIQAVAAGTGIGVSTVNGTATVSNSGVTSVNGSTGAVTISAGTWKAGTSSRQWSAASGSQTIAHGLGKTPSYIKITTYFGASGGTSTWSVGTYDGTNTNVVYMDGTVGTNGSLSAGSGSGNIVVSTDGTNGQTATVTLDSTNINLSWTKNGAPAISTLLNFLWEVYG